MKWVCTVLSKLSPTAAGLLSGGIVLTCSLACSVSLYRVAVVAQKEGVRLNLVRAASQAAAVINGDQHRRFRERAQERSPEYKAAVAPLDRMLASTDDLAFVYTCILENGKVYFVLDPTSQGDADLDGVDDKSHVMEPYEEATPAMLSALRHARPTADIEPTADKWGSFISGYAPFFDSRGALAGIVGVDLRAEAYVERLARLRNGIIASVMFAFVLSAAVGFGAGSLRRTLVSAHARQRLDQSRSEVIERLVRAAEYRDDDTGHHVVRMAMYCEALARHLGLSKEDCTMLRAAAPMHDVGKIGIPDEVLHKRGRLTPEEFKVVKTHTTMGADLLAGSEYELIQLAEVIALTHHERWDGTGYPRGLRGEEIPLVGRICAVCDVFDALTSSRPYKDAWPLDRAVSEIESMSGTFFEPRIVEAFLSILPEIEAIMRKFGEEPPPLRLAA
jgi:HD-GYP domain-containing protein (c-di-GMP phosphodiesterase class II)